jgi:hypothetical protein
MGTAAFETPKIRLQLIYVLCQQKIFFTAGAAYTYIVCIIVTQTIGVARGAH